MSKLSRDQHRRRIHTRIRKRLSGSPERPRLSVFRSLQHIYAQVIDDAAGRTLVAASSMDEAVRSMKDESAEEPKEGKQDAESKPAKKGKVAAKKSEAAQQPAKLGGNIPTAAKVGRLVAERAKEAGVTKIVFDRGGYRYHGRVKALAEAARKAGLEF